MTRVPLPCRRPSLTASARWQGHDITVTLGFDATGAVREVFADAPKGGQMREVLSDACVLISIALQHGIPAAALGKSLGRVPDIARGEGATDHASPLGAIVALVERGAA